MTEPATTLAALRVQRRDKLLDAFDSLPASEEHALDAIAGIASDTQLEDVGALVPYVFVGSRGAIMERLGVRSAPVSDRLRAAAIVCAGRVVRTSLVGNLPRLADVIGYLSWSYRSTHTSWGQLAPTSVSSLVAGRAERPELLGILSFHGNGFVREEAVRLLADDDPQRALPFLLLRANDWVPEVRAAATVGIERVIARQQVEAVAAAAPIIVRLSNARRVDHTELVDRLTELLACVDDGAGVHIGLAAGDRSVRRAVLQLAGSLSTRARCGVADAVATDADVVVRSWAARQLEVLEATAPEQASTLRALFLTDSAISIRRLALYSLLRTERQDALRVLPPYLMHRSRSLRRLARFHLMRAATDGGAGWSREAVLEVYLQALDAAPVRQVVAAASLGEVGDASHLPALRTLLADGSARPARVALRSISKLDASMARTLSLEHLGDPRTGVRREASRLLGARLRASDLAAVRRAADELGAADVPFVVRLARKLPEWQGLILLLELASADGYRAAMLAELSAWRATAHSETPTPREWDSLASAYASAASVLPARLRAQLETEELPFGDGPVFPGPAR